MASQVIYHNWTAPPFEELNFATNCTLVGEWSNAWYLGQETDGNVGDIAIGNYFRAALPSEMRGMPTQGQLIDWYHAAQRYGYVLQLQNKTNTFIEATIIKPFNVCPKEFCAGFPFGGAPDVTGIGVLLNYYVQAAICSLLTTLILWELWRHKRHRVAGRKIQNITDSCKASLDIFRSGLEVITLSMTVATIVIAADRSPHRDYIQLELAQELVIFSVLSVILLDVLNDLSFPDSERPSRLLTTVLIVLLYLVDMYYGDWSIQNAEGEIGEALCYDASWVALRVAGSDLRWLYSGVGCLSFLSLVILPSLCKSRLPNASKRLLKIRKHFKVPLVIAISFCMWAHLVNVTIARHRFIELSGSNIADTRWTFGQVIAVLTWQPVILELYYLLTKGIQKTLSARVPEPWVVYLPGDLETGVTIQDTKPVVDSRSRQTSEDGVELLSHAANTAGQETRPPQTSSSYRRLSRDSEHSHGRASEDHPDGTVSRSLTV